MAKTKDNEIRSNRFAYGPNDLQVIEPMRIKPGQEKAFREGFDELLAKIKARQDKERAQKNQ
ncbi:hypothetical protein [Lacticaseibacillus mingshuiensis]|uniref:hypothetical protein n=1 Tax=Lacticaseibacillus mingshuiensis TaxID=2799574 RepID=UPI00194E335A|nr:hypothetical protein [Lacticaseibacillus mingshuiensis]